MSQIQQGVLGSTNTGGAVLVSFAGNSTLGSGSQTVTTAGTRVQLSAISIPCKKVTIQGLSSNTAQIYIGDSTVSSANGIYVFPTQIFQLTVSNLNLIWLDSVNNGEGVSYQYEN